MIDIAGAILSRATQRVEMSSQNITNLTTVGYKARRLFPALVAGNSDELLAGARRATSIANFTQGKLQNTGNPLDLALSGPGFFVVRSNAGTFYTRSGQFSRDGDGRLVTPDGMALQSLSGDVIGNGADPHILADGTVLENGQPVAQLAIATFADLQALRPVGGGLYAAPAGSASQVASPQVHQGMLEASNVSTADEIIAVMAALRSAESGQRVVQVYDDLMGRALTAFGQA